MVIEPMKIEKIRTGNCVPDRTLLGRLLGPNTLFKGM